MQSLSSEAWQDHLKQHAYICTSDSYPCLRLSCFTNWQCVHYKLLLEGSNSKGPGIKKENKKTHWNGCVSISPATEKVSWNSIKWKCRINTLIHLNTQWASSGSMNNWKFTAQVWKIEIAASFIGQRDSTVTGWTCVLHTVFQTLPVCNLFSDTSGWVTGGSCAWISQLGKNCDIPSQRSTNMARNRDTAVTALPILLLL